MGSTVLICTLWDFPVVAASVSPIFLRVGTITWPNKDEKAEQLPFRDSDKEVN